MNQGLIEKLGNILRILPLVTFLPLSFRISDFNILLNNFNQSLPNIFSFISSCSYFAIIALLFSTFVTTYIFFLILSKSQPVTKKVESLDSMTLAVLVINLITIGACSLILLKFHVPHYVYFVFFCLGIVVSFLFAVLVKIISPFEGTNAHVILYILISGIVTGVAGFSFSPRILNGDYELCNLQIYKEEDKGYYRYSTSFKPNSLPSNMSFYQVKGRNIKKAKLRELDLDMIDFNDVDASYAEIYDVRFEKSKQEKVSYKEAQIDGCTWKDCTFVGGVQFQEADFIRNRSAFIHSNLYGTDIDTALINRSEMNCKESFIDIIDTPDVLKKELCHLEAHRLRDCLCDKHTKTKNGD